MFSICQQSKVCLRESHETCQEHTGPGDISLESQKEIRFYILQKENNDSIIVFSCFALLHFDDK